MTHEKCPVCNSELTTPSTNSSGNIFVYNCENCGHFTIDESFRGFNSGNRHLIAGYLNETQNDYLFNKERIDNLNKENTEKLLSSSLIPKTSMQRLDKFLLNLYRQGKDFKIRFSYQKLIPQIAYAKDREELYQMIRSLCDLGYIIERNYAGDDGYDITIKGLEHAESLLTENKLSTKAFIAMKFSEEMKSVKENSIKPAVSNCGFEAFTVDEEEHNEDITDRIISGIKTSRFVIADFTENNHGVYYEAGYAKGLGIQVIKTCRKDWFDNPAVDEKGKKVNKLHFDIEHDNLILWENEKDLAEKLEARIRATIL